MKVLIIGSGGREHALAWKSAQDKSVTNVFVCPGNAGTALEQKITNIFIDANNFDAIEGFCKEEDIGLVIIGPEQPLVNGMTDYLQSKGILRQRLNLKGLKHFQRTSSLNTEYQLRHMLHLIITIRQKTILIKLNIQQWSKLTD